MCISDYIHHMPSIEMEQHTFKKFSFWSFGCNIKLTIYPRIFLKFLGRTEY